MCTTMKIGITLTNSMTLPALHGTVWTVVQQMFHSVPSPCSQMALSAPLVLGLAMWLDLANGLLLDMPGAVGLRTLANWAWVLVL